MSPKVEKTSGLWTPITWRAPGLRKYGVPPEGSWNPALEIIFQALGTPLLLGEAAMPGPGEAVRLYSSHPCAWVIFGSKGWAVRGLEEASVPALVVGAGSCGLTAESGGRWTIAAFNSSATPLLRSLLTSPKSESAPIRIIPLPGHQHLLEECSWMVSPQSSRIGLRLLGPAPDLGVLSASRPSAPGVIQAARAGELLVHGPSGPTSGGYPALGAVIRSDLHRLAELPPGAAVQFLAVSPEEARQAWLELCQSAERTAAALAKLKRLGVV